MTGAKSLEDKGNAAPNESRSLGGWPASFVQLAANRIAGDVGALVLESYT
jgi:hypothetical protein